MEEIKTEEAPATEAKTEEVKAEESRMKNFCKNMLSCRCECTKKHKIIAGIALLALVIIIGGAFFYYKKTQKTDVGPAAVKSRIENLVADSKGAVTVGDVVLEGDLYKVTINAGGSDQSVYVTKDGTKLIPNLMSFDDLEKQKAAAAQAQPQAQPKEITKSDRPKVELFVMSYCPYGTQMEKGILPVVKTLGAKIDYTLRFVDYAMHGDKELAENMLQYCIEKTQPAKLSAYLDCFLKKGEGTSDTCLASAGIASAGIKACVAQTDSTFSVTKNAADKSTWSNGQFPTFDVDKEANKAYGVQGSPTLVINGTTAESAGRDSASILKTICGAFKNAPKECGTKLSTAAPAPGFGEGSASAGSGDASCGN